MLFSERPPIYASCMTISGGRTEQLNIIGFLPRHWLYKWSFHLLRLVCWSSSSSRYFRANDSVITWTFSVLNKSWSKVDWRMMCSLPKDQDCHELWSKRRKKVMRDPGVEKKSDLLTDAAVSHSGSGNQWSPESESSNTKHSDVQSPTAASQRKLYQSVIISFRMSYQVRC